MKRIILTAAFLVSAGIFFAEDLSLVTINAWLALDYKGFINAGQYEPGEVRQFREEVLISGLKELNPDAAVLNGLNPADSRAGEIAAELDLDYNSAVSRSGIRIGPVSLPVNLREGDAVLADSRFSPEPAGRKLLGGGISNNTFTLFSRSSSQIICTKLNTSAGEIYVYSAVWRGSRFSDRASIIDQTDKYLSGEISPQEYAGRIGDAVFGTEERITQAEETLAFINGTAGKAPVILMGSLNALPGSKEMSILKEAGFTDVYEAVGRGEGYTWDSSVNSNISKMGDSGLSGKYRIDYILIRGGDMVPVSAEVVFNEPVYGVYASTHFGVKAVVRLPESPSAQ
jgi:hypothetical protein